MKRSNIAAFLLIFYVIMMLVLAVMPSVQAPDGFDKAAHFIEFFIFGMLLMFVLFRSRHKYLLAWLVILLAAVASEMLQLGVDREFELMDISANLLGGVAAMFVIIVMELYIRCSPQHLKT